MLPKAFACGLCTNAFLTCQDPRDDLEARAKELCQERWDNLVQRGGWQECSPVCKDCASEYLGIQTEACVLLLSDSGYSHGCYREAKCRPYPDFFR